MKNTPKLPIPKKPAWSWLQHKDFVSWWKDHIHSGFVADSDGKYHWNISPPEAWRCARYRSEFTGQDQYASKEEMQR